MDTKKNEIKITKEVMLQYEAVRRSGATNMYDYYNVMYVARQLKFKELASLTYEDYEGLLLNFGTYMRKYDISQR